MGRDETLRTVVPDRITVDDTDEVIKGGEVVRVFDPWHDKNGKWIGMGISRQAGETGARTADEEPSRGDPDCVQPYELTDWNPWQQSGGPASRWKRCRASPRNGWRPAPCRPAPTFRPSPWPSCTSSAVSSTIASACSRNAANRFPYPPELWSMLIGPPSTDEVGRGAVRHLLPAPLRPPGRQCTRLKCPRCRCQRARPEDAEKNEPPSRRRLLVDATIEGSRKSCRTRIAAPRWSATNCRGWLNGMDRYGHGSDRPFWLEAKGGGYFVVDRIKGSREVNVLSIGVFGGIQPERLKDLSSLTDDGLFQRFSPVNMRPAGDECDDDADPGLYQHFDDLVADLGRIPPQTLVLDEDAAAAYVEFSNFMRKASTIAIPNEAFGTFLGKQARTLATIALLLHIVDLSHTFDPPLPPVPLATCTGRSGSSNGSSCRMPNCSIRPWSPIPSPRRNPSPAHSSASPMKGPW